MSVNIYTTFYQFLDKHEKNHPSSTKDITTDRIATMLYEIIVQHFPESSSFSNEYFRQVLAQVAQAIINVVFRQQQIFVSIDQLVTYINILQFIVHCDGMQLPSIIQTKLEKYIYSLLFLQNCLKMKSIYEDSLNSATISSFYKGVYINAFEFRYKQLMKSFGIVERSIFLASYMLRDIVEKNQFDIENYESHVTSQWITLSLVYYILASKYKYMKQIPVLSKILQRYHSSYTADYAFRKINGFQLCHFYNNFVVDRIKKAESYEVDIMIDETTVDHDKVATLLVNPINNENNTVLDNIIFSSSWEH